MEQVVPHKIEIQKRYEAYREVFLEILSKIESKLKSQIHLASMPTYKARIKSFNSYYKKVLRQRANDAITKNELIPLTDMIGIRVICAFLEDLDEVEKQISTSFTVREVEKKGAEQSFREFGYESVHVLIDIPEDCLPTEHTDLPLPKGLVCEIQIRTILQDAWAEVEHELIYKSEFNPFDKPLRRKLASINASLSLADTIFQEIRDYQNRLQSELGTRRNTFYEKADELGDEELGITRSPQKVPQEENLPAPKSSGIESPFAKGSIDDLVLEALHEHNLGNFTKATKIYTKILKAKPVPPDMVLAVIYKHRGMAYFAENKYDQALEDFKMSVEKDPKAFRALYYEGIVYSAQGKDENAIDCFDQSLAIDKFQSHVYYRRALANYNLGNYKTALDDIHSAINLGLEDEDVRTLKAKLLKKFDMGM